MHGLVDWSTASRMWTQRWMYRIRNRTGSWRVVHPPDQQQLLPIGRYGSVNLYRLNDCLQKEQERMNGGLGLKVVLYISNPIFGHPKYAQKVFRCPVMKEFLF